MKRKTVPTERVPKDQIYDMINQMAATLKDKDYRRDGNIYSRIQFLKECIDGLDLLGGTVAEFGTRKMDAEYERIEETVHNWMIEMFADALKDETPHLQNVQTKPICEHCYTCPHYAQHHPQGDTTP